MKKTNKPIEILAYWENQPNEQFSATCMIGKWDGISNDDDIFYWFNENEEIIGNHGDFVVLNYFLK